MLASKDAHFGFLADLQHKHEHGGQRTLAEAARLQQRLAEHDQCVGAFAFAIRELGTRDRSAHTALVSALASLNTDVGGPRGAVN